MTKHIITMITLVALATPAAAGIAAMIECATIQDDTKRLECYDAETEKEKAMRKEGCQINLMSLNVAGNPKLGMIQAVGEIKNVSGDTLKRARALAMVYNKEGAMVATEDMGVEIKTIPPSEKSPFKVYIKYPHLDQVGKVVVKFTIRGEKLKSCSDKVKISD